MPRRDFTKVPFAATGDTVSIPTPSQADGTISLATGWGYDYERDNGAGGGTPDPLAKNISRPQMNGILNEITASLGEIQLNGYPLWSATAVPYPINAVVRYGTKNFISLIDNNSTTPVAGANWGAFDASSLRPMGGPIVMLTSGIYTPSPGMRYCKVRIVGGGAGGGGVAATAAGQYAASAGGSSGSYGESFYTAAQIGASVAVNIGNGGLGGVASSAGSPGGNTTFGAFTAPGGGGGGGCLPIATNLVSTSIPGASQGITTGGTLLNSNGIPGTTGIASPTNGSISGTGGGSPMLGGSGGGPQAGNGPSVGNNAIAPGAGGGGICTGSPGAAGAAKNGGAGMSGAVIIEEYA